MRLAAASTTPARRGHAAVGALAALMALTLLAPAGMAAAPAAPASPADLAAPTTPAASRGTLLPLPTSLLVTLDATADGDLAAADEAAAARGLQRVAWNPRLRTAQYIATSPTGDAAAIAAARRADGVRRARLDRVGAQLDALPGVAAAAPPVPLRTFEDPPAPVAAPNDPLWSSQWGPEAIGVRAAWALTRGRPEVVVAVLDTGVDAGHPDLAGRLIPGTDLGSGDSVPEDDIGHGTHVAGIVAAASGNGRGVSGTAPNVLVMPVKVMDDAGSIWDTTVAEGILWAADRGARVVNLSLGGDEPSAPLEAAIDSVRARGVVVVAAAGNHDPGDPDPGVSQPGAYGPALAVAAVGDVGAVAGPPGTPARYAHAMYSNTGGEVDLAAPGTGIVSTYPTWADADYGPLTGTSMATPFVAAAAALVISRNPALTADEVEAALVGTAVDLGEPGVDPDTGAGLLRADAAVAAVAAPTADGTAPVVGISGILDGTLVRGSRTISITAADASPIVAVRVVRDGRSYLVRRSSSVSIGWSTRSVSDGLRRWSAYATDTGLAVGSRTVRVLVANRRDAAEIRTSLRMTGGARTITRAIAIARTGPFVARFWGPAGSTLTVRLVDSRGRVAAESKGIGAAALAITSLRAGRYTLRASAASTRPGLYLRLSAAWYR